LLLLAAGRGWGQAAVGLCGYLAAMHMSEPAIQSLLMDRVAPEERSGASATYFLVTSLAQAGAAIVGGATISRHGYRALLFGAVFAMGVSAVFFRVLCSPSSETPLWTTPPMDLDDEQVLSFPK
jgi:MFS family permease